MSTLASYCIGAESHQPLYARASYPRQAHGFLRSPQLDAGGNERRATLFSVKSFRFPLNVLLCLLLALSQLAGTHLHRHADAHKHEQLHGDERGHHHESLQQLEVSVVTDVADHDDPEAVHDDVSLDSIADRLAHTSTDLPPLALLLAFVLLWPVSLSRPSAPGYRSPPRPPPALAFRPPLRGPPLISVA